MRSILAGAIVMLSSASALAEAPNPIEGTGKGYSAEIIVADVSAALVIPATIVPTWSSNPWIWSIPLSGAPLALSGPIMHFAHGRYVFASASFFGWASVIATSWAVGGLSTMMFHLSPVCDQFRPCARGPDDSWAGVAMGVGVGVLGTALMTWLDAWMARPFHKATRQQNLSPTVSMSGAGASAGLLGSF